MLPSTHYDLILDLSESLFIVFPTTVAITYVIRNAAKYSALLLKVLDNFIIY